MCTVTWMPFLVCNELWVPFLTIQADFVTFVAAARMCVKYLTCLNLYTICSTDATKHVLLTVDIILIICKKKKLMAINLSITFLSWAWPIFVPQRITSVQAFPFNESLLLCPLSIVSSYWNYTTCKIKKKITAFSQLAIYCPSVVLFNN